VLSPFVFRGVCPELSTPERCLLRGDTWVFGPEEPSERTGDVGNVAFPCGVTVADDGDSLHMYYGGADSCIALATSSTRALLDWLHSKPSVRKVLLW
jgi:predicted GH43/DUF377 family glycosyl hydrolase